MPQNGAKRLINGRFIDPIRRLENRGQMPMISFEKIENISIPKIKDEAPYKWAI